MEIASCASSKGGRISRAAVRMAAGALAILLSVSGCGGGGGGGSDGGGDIAFVTLDYPNTTVRVGTGVTIRPTVTGIPGGVAPQYSATGLPAGLQIASSTGVISGTPTTPAPNQIATVKLTLSGYSGSVSEGAYINVVAAAAYTWSRASTGLPPFLKYDVVRVNGSLYAIGTTFTSNGFGQVTSTGAIQTWRSTDEGVTWTNINSAPTTGLRHFAIAQTTTGAYLTGGADGGSGANSNEVWHFDGTTWSQVAVVTPFSARRRHASIMVGSSLYVVGGVAANGNTHPVNEGTTGHLNDVWRSNDGGLNWTQITASAQFQPRFGHCLVSFKGQMWLLGGYYGGQFTQAFTSADGAVWSQIGSIPTPFTSASAYGACAVHRDQLVLVGGTPFAQFGLAFGNADLQPGASPDSSLYYSADGSGWTKEVPSYSSPSAPSFVGRYGHSLATSPAGSTTGALLSVGSQNREVWRLE